PVALHHKLRSLGVFVEDNDAHQQFSIFGGYVVIVGASAGVKRFAWMSVDGAEKSLADFGRRCAMPLDFIIIVVDLILLNGDLHVLDVGDAKAVDGGLAPESFTVLHGERSFSSSHEALPAPFSDDNSHCTLPAVC